MGLVAHNLLSRPVASPSLLPQRSHAAHLRLVVTADASTCYDASSDDGPQLEGSARFVFAALAGRFVEVSGEVDGATLTTGMRLVREAQESGDTTAWVQCAGETFYPPDVEAMGVDLAALVVVRVPAVVEVARAASKLAQSGAFGLIVCDLAGYDFTRTQIAAPLLSRLMSLAQKHHTAVVCLTHKAPALPSQGSLVSLRMQTRRERSRDRHFHVVSEAIKDKRRGPFWTHEEHHHAPPGLR